jgi:hypothetical protein
MLRVRIPLQTRPRSWSRFSEPTATIPNASHPGGPPPRGRPLRVHGVVLSGHGVTSTVDDSGARLEVQLRMPENSPPFCGPAKSLYSRCSARVVHRDPRSAAGNRPMSGQSRFGIVAALCLAASSASSQTSESDAYAIDYLTPPPAPSSRSAAWASCPTAGCSATWASGPTADYLSPLGAVSSGASTTRSRPTQAGEVHAAARRARRGLGLNTSLGAPIVMQRGELSRISLSHPSRSTRSTTTGDSRATITSSPSAARRRPGPPLRDAQRLVLLAEVVARQVAGAVSRVGRRL